MTNEQFYIDLIADHLGLRGRARVMVALAGEATLFMISDMHWAAFPFSISLSLQIPEEMTIKPQGINQDTGEVIWVDAVTNQSSLFSTLAGAAIEIYHF